MFDLLLSEMPVIKRKGNSLRLVSKSFDWKEIEKNLGLKDTGRRDCPVQRHHLFLFASFLPFHQRHLQSFRKDFEYGLKGCLSLELTEIA